LVDAKLLKLRLPSSGLCSDEEFVRRVTVDVTGLLPTEAETASFLASTDPNKRAALVDTLLGRKEFSEIWAMKWADLLMIKSNNQVSYKAAYLYYNWLINKIASNTPIDQIVRELLTATGGTFQSPQTNFYQGLHGDSYAMCTVPQSPVRSMDDG
jgi:CHAT domain-containing protein